MDTLIHLKRVRVFIKFIFAQLLYINTIKGEFIYKSVFCTYTRILIVMNSCQF